MKRAVRVIALGLLWLPVSAYGQEEPPPVAAGPVVADPATADPADADLAAVQSATRGAVGEPETDVRLDMRTRFGAGIGVSGPLGAAARVSLFHGLGADVRDDTTRVKAVCALPIRYCANGFLVQADVGTGGGKLSLGLGAHAKVDEESFKGTAGVAARLAVAHTWGDPIGTEPGLTYLGPELDLSVIHVNVTLGLLFRIAGHGGASVLFSWGLGFGT
jgi:hypothetical protein